jgi:serine protease AprX
MADLTEQIIIAAFNHLRTENRILGTYDYVNNDSTVFESIAHGTNVLSCIAGIISNQYLGTSTKSNFYLFLTENASSERLQEEFNLATALERCDQLGVDVVNISLGIHHF